MKNDKTTSLLNFNNEPPEKNEWDLLLKLIPFLENNHKAIVHIIEEKKNYSDYKIWAIIRFKRTNYLAEINELEQVLHVLRKKYDKHISYCSRKNKIFIRGASQPIEIPEYHDDLPF
ncbi:MAG: hypothetical protein CL853_07575 [Crocinitomicaceae bacterium]|nr:hypothetical protein [Crocinitomicaceae bacterium]